MRLPLTIDGVDFSTLANKHAYTLTYIKREGSNGGIMLDGSRTVDVLAWKAQITWDLNDMSASELAAIQTAVKASYVTVTFLDTDTDSERTAEMIPTLTGATIGILRDSGKWWQHPTLTLEER